MNAPGTELVPDDEGVSGLEAELADDRAGDRGKHTRDELRRPALECEDAHDRRVRGNRLLERRLSLGVSFTVGGPEEASAM